MEDLNPQVEKLIDDISEEITNENTENRWIKEAIFVTALDIEKNPEIKLHRDFPELDSAINEVRDTQPEWVLREISESDLPDGFSQKASQGEAEIIDLNDPILDHEWLMYPGDDFVEVLVRQYYPIICGNHSLQSLAQATKSDKNVVRDGTILLVTNIASGELTLVPLFALLTLHIVEENIDKVCEEYEPY